MQESNYLQLKHKQYFECAKCGILKFVYYGEDDSPLQVVKSMQTKHAELSPKCKWHINNIKIKRPDFEPGE